MFKTRCLGLALAIVVAALFGSSVASAQTHATGLTVTKTCPDPTMPVAQGASYDCTFAVTNSGDAAHGVNNLAVTNTFPWISAGNAGNGPTLPVSCMQGGVAVTALGPAGTATASCSGTVTETAPHSCSLTSQQINDRIAVTATDSDTTPGGFGGAPVSGSATNGPIVSPATCDDGLFCTDDSCTVGVGCVTAPHPCGDQSLCTADSCDEGANTCVNAPVVCNDGNACTIDSCDPATGSATVCLTTPVTCNDGNSCTIDSCDVVEGCVAAPDPTCEIDGRMTGGGSVFSGMNRITHGFEIHCRVENLPNNIQVNWGRGHQFHLEELLTATCTEDPAIDQTPPGHSPFDTFIGTGIGRCNGVSGALISFTFVDGGEPGFRHDTAQIEITGCPNDLELTVSGPLKKGNHQAHRLTGSDLP